MINDFLIIFFWGFLLLLLGFSFLPLAFSLFGKFFDKGYPFAKIIAVLTISYLVWVLGSFKILPFRIETIWLLIIASLFANFLIFKKRRQNLKKILRKSWRIFIFEEFLFLFVLFGWSLVRAYQPNIHGLEKFMDYGFLNSLLRSDYFPPVDMWLTGETINYYYFGHLISAVLTKLSSLNSAVSYNLMIATVFALSFTASFSLGSNLTFFSLKSRLSGWLKIKISKKWSIKLMTLSGLLTAFVLNLGGNLHPLWWWLQNKNFESYWYPDATRFIVEKFGAMDNTIHEFPVYSFVVADLHGHMINLPNVLLILALLLVLVLKIIPQKNLKKTFPLTIALAFFLAIAFMTNAWDYPIYLLTIGLSVFLFNKLRFSWEQALLRSIITGGILFLGSLIFSLPFHLHFKNIAGGVGLTDFHSPPRMLLVLWGLPLLMTLFFLIFSANLLKKDKLERLTKSDYLAGIFLIVGWLLVFIPEIAYVKDIYIHSHQRANTVFKLTYQSFLMFSLSIGYLLPKLVISFKNRLLKLLLVTVFFPLLAFIFIYPFFATDSYYGLEKYQGLNGIAYLEKSYPNDYQGILWLKKNILGQPVLLEAVGESYTDFARVSANTGLPTVLGWRVHEWLWRGSFDKPSQRTEEVRLIYQSTDSDQVKKLINKHQIRLIFIGQLERQQYPELDIEKFNQLGKLVFSSGETKIYQIN